MAKGYVQVNNVGAAPAGSPLTTVMSFPGSITAGNAVAVYIHQTTSGATRTYTVTGSTTSTTGWVRHLRHSAGVGGPELWVHPNHPGGSETVTVTHGSATGDFRCMMAEYSGMGGTVTLVASDVFTDGATTTTHYSAGISGVTDASDVLGLLCGGAMSSAWTDCFATGIWTEASGSNFMLSAYTVQPTGVSGERGQYTSTGTARVGRGLIAFFTGAVPAPTVTDVTPDSDVSAGGESVTITGTGFVSGAQATFGGTAATGESVTNATTMTATVPAHAEGVVTVRVTNPDAQYGELGSAFTYDDAYIPLPEVLQGPTGVGVSGTTGTAEIELLGTTAGSRILGIVIQTSADLRSYGVSDDVNGAYDSVLVYNPGRGVYVFEIRDNIGGDLTLAFTKTVGGASTAVAYAMEVANLRDDIAPTISTRLDSGNTTTHPGSAAPGMGTDAYPVFVLSASALSGTRGSSSPATDYTAATLVSDNHYVQYRIAETGILDDQAAWTSSNSRIATSAQLAFYSAAGEDPEASTDGVRVAMLW